MRHRILRPSTAIPALILLAGLASSQRNAQIDPIVEVRPVADAFELSITLGVETSVLRSTSSSISEAAVRTVPGRRALAVTWTEVDAARNETPYYALSLDGSSFHDARPTAYELKLRQREFDPRGERSRAFPPLLAGRASDVYVVQYWTQGIEAYRETLASLGAEIHLFLAWNSNVVEMDRETAKAVRGLPFVRWVGRFHPAYKLEEELYVDQMRGFSEEPFQRVNILTLERGPLGQEPVLAKIAEIGGTLEHVSAETYLLSATLSLGQIATLARMDEVQWIDRWAAPENDMNIARSFHGASTLLNNTGFSGQGVHVEVMDSGTEPNHADMQNYIIHNGNSSDRHGTCTAGIVVGTGGGDGAAKGAMPDAFLVIADYQFPYAGGSRYSHTDQLQDPLLPYECVLQTNSWGSGLTASYNSISQDIDLILFDHDRISILQSQSNQGTQLSRPQAWAKNVISVGGIFHGNSGTKLDDSWSGGASIGPAADGRIKPDIASFYDSIHCTDEVGGAGYSSGDYYSFFGGTSGATPIVAGHLGLIYQMWHEELFGNEAPGVTPFDNRPFNTTAKAILINTALQWNFSGAGADLTRVHQGWGHPRLQTAYTKRDKMLIVDEDQVLSELQGKTYEVVVDPGTPKFKATMVYRDPPGTTSSSLHRINDLDLRVTSPSGTVYWGNNGLLANQYSTPGGSPNTLDTVENVFVQDPQPGVWSVRVIASEVNQDGHVETPQADVDYALVIHEVSEKPVYHLDPPSGTALSR